MTSPLAAARAALVVSACLGALASATDASAQSIGVEPPAGARMIELDEFRDLFLGKTVTFVLGDGSIWGREYYGPDGAAVTFEHANGECLEGVWEKRGDFYCFDYPAGAACWLTYEIDGEIEVAAESGQVQRISEIVENDPISCRPELFSRNEADAVLQRDLIERPAL